MPRALLHRAPPHCLRLSAASPGARSDCRWGESATNRWAPV